MKLRPKGLSIRYYVSALLVLVSAAGLLLAWTIYRRAAEPDLAPPPPEVAENGDTDMRELEALFREQPVEPGRYRVIVKQNLFSERRAPAPQPAQQAAQAEPGRREDVQLLGTSIMGENKSALLRFLRFSDSAKPRIVQEGQTMKDPGNQAQGQSYTVVSIEQGRVVLADQTGQRFAVAMGPQAAAGTAGAARAGPDNRPELAEPEQDPGDRPAEPMDSVDPNEPSVPGLDDPHPTDQDQSRKRPPQALEVDERLRQAVQGTTRQPPGQQADNTTSGTWSTGQ